jgi:hypothetical protein
MKTKFLAVALAAFFATMPAHAANVLSQAIEKAQPCRVIKVTKLGVTISVDKFKSANIESLKVDIAGDAAKIAIVGSLACGTQEKSAIHGDFFAKFSAAAQLNLATCLIDESSVQILSTGGSYGALIDVFKHEIEKVINHSVSEKVKALCS